MSKTTRLPSPEPPGTAGTLSVAAPVDFPLPATLGPLEPSTPGEPDADVASLSAIVPPFAVAPRAGASAANDDACWLGSTPRPPSTATTVPVNEPTAAPILRSRGCGAGGGRREPAAPASRAMQDIVEGS